ncbi:SCO6745 family protein [Chloroflexus sp.]|uniref:SCO6745 family protein n=1 Tax=Chloroflexus sp. TaxID=1904827 RepID=UPI00298F2114|nr:hypothetical protein [Chloroflexus sp.]MDW8403831.1 hypothetical protein [Chloroflexus sp.]
MDYDTAYSIFFQPAPTGTPIPPPMLANSPARQLRDAIEPLGIHPAWSRLVNERLAAYGLNFLSGYVWGRAAPMGEPVAALVASAFAAFEPTLIANLYEEGRRAVDRATLLRVQEEATIASLHAILGDVDVEPVVTALRRGVEAADGTGRPLFTGVRSLPWPTHPLAQLWRVCHALREHRGDSHIIAYTAAGFSPVEMNILTELWVGWPLGSFSATRAWGPDQTEQALARLRADGLLAGNSLTEAGHAARQAIEDRTDALEQAVVAAIGDDLPNVVAQLNYWGAQVTASGNFPPDLRKRAAG